MSASVSIIAGLTLLKRMFLLAISSAADRIKASSPHLVIAYSALAVDTRYTPAAEEMNTTEEFFANFFLEKGSEGSHVQKCY